MSTPSNVDDFPLEPEDVTPPIARPTRPLYWSLRRELWENRSIYMAPLIVAAVIVFGFLLSTIGMPHRRRALLSTDLAHQRAVIAQPYDMAATMLIVIAFVVGAFYCLDALHGERRDRSILFWKSLPVSDRTTVLAKAGIPLVVLPLITWAVVIATQFMMLIWSTLVLLPSGLAGTTWTRYGVLQQAVILTYGIIVLALWHAPVYGWLLLVSAWSRRTAFLWAVLPVAAVSALEKIAFNTSYFGKWIGYRLFGGVTRAFAFRSAHGGIDSLAQLRPGTFLSTPGLWIGWIAAAAFLAAAVCLRRNREPI
jgi:ABC-2 type transport system permease protein